jgi:AraC family transcriptional regulator of arabinose operon
LGQFLYNSAIMPADLTFLFGQYVPKCNHRINKHFGYNVIQLLDGGSVDLSVGTDKFHLEGRWFWSSYPGPRIAFHAADAKSRWVHRYLAFVGPGVERWTEMGLFPIAPQPVHRQDHFPALFDELLALSQRTDRWGIARASLLLETILTELAEARSKPQATPAWLDPVLAMAQKLGADFHQDELAKEAGMTPRTFRRRFGEIMGTSPRDYVIACRVAHAKEMLGRTELPVKTIAEQLGYRDVFYFTRQFRQTTGVAPVAYRKSREG